MLDTRVFTFRVLADEDRIDVVVGRLESLDGRTGPDIGEQVKCSTQCQVERNVTLPDYERLVWNKEGVTAYVLTRGCEGTCRT